MLSGYRKDKQQASNAQGDSYLVSTFESMRTARAT